MITRISCKEIRAGAQVVSLVGARVASHAITEANVKALDSKVTGVFLHYDDDGNANGVHMRTDGKDAPDKWFDEDGSKA